MNLDELRGHLRALRRERHACFTQQHADALRTALDEPWIDAALATEIQAALARVGVSAAWRARPLRVGESYLLLCDPSTREGAALRWCSRVSEAPVVLTTECTAALDRAWRGLLSVLSEAGHALPTDFTRAGFEAPALPRAERIDGASLSVSACAAWLSRACGVSLPDHIAASAEVRSNGTIAPVALLAEKLTALRASWPSVTHVVVARDQALDGSTPDGVTLVRCATLRDAIERFGVPFDTLPECSIEEHVAQVARYRTENARRHGTDAWRDLSAKAWATAQALARDETEQVNAGRARAWAALFALHAGDDATARELSRSLGVPEDPSVAAWLTVVSATSAIDSGGHDEAIAQVDGVLRDAHQLPAEHRWIEGHARGTRGRALLHAGRYMEALDTLEETKRWFLARKEPWEAARTSKDIATGLRLCGRPDDALAVVEQALRWLDDARSRREVSAKTRDFLTLELGRCLLAGERPGDALGAFEQVVSAQMYDYDYPRLGALRGVVVANRRLGRFSEAADAIARCVAVARRCPPGDTLGRVAAIVAAEALVDRDASALERSRDAWERHFEDPSETAMRAALARQVY